MDVDLYLEIYTLSSIFSPQGILNYIFTGKLLIYAKLLNLKSIHTVESKG